MLSFSLDNVQYEAKALGAWLGTRERGVFSAGNNLAVSAAGGLGLSVSSGLAWLKKSGQDGVLCTQEEALGLSLGAPGTEPRLDAVCLRLDKTSGQAAIIIKQGAPGAEPELAPPTRNESLDEIYLASVLVAPGATEIGPEDVTDLRLNKSCCGLVRDGVTMIPVDALETQIRELITEIRETLSRQEAYPELLGLVYPVGSVYMSVSSASPASLFGGEWEAMEGRFLVGAGSSFAPGSQGGASSHSHGTKSLALSLSQIPSHSHSFSYNNYRMQDSGNSGYGEYSNVIGPDYTRTTSSAGGSAAHNHGSTDSASSLPPYTAVYMWRRTA